MLTEIIRPGDKFDIEILNNFNKNAKKTTYSSQIYDIIDKDKIVAMLPINKGMIVPLPVNEKYEMVIYSKNALYMCRAVLKERYRENNMHVMVLEIYTGLKKHQRREYYRLTYSLDLTYYLLGDDPDTVSGLLDEILGDGTADDFGAAEKAAADIGAENKGSIQGITIDISGGGMRFVSQKRTEKDEYMLLKFEVMVDNKKIPYSQLAKVVYTKEVPNRKNTYEHRVQFEKMTIPERELLIKFIFEQERRYRNIEKS